MSECDDKRKKDILNRLKRIEGQVKGIQGMVERDSCCNDILIQISAIRSAINKVGGLMLENYACNCLGSEEDTIEQENIQTLIKTINTFIK